MVNLVPNNFADKWIFSRYIFLYSELIIKLTVWKKWSNENISLQLLLSLSALTKLLLVLAKIFIFSINRFTNITLKITLLLRYYVEKQSLSSCVNINNSNKYVEFSRALLYYHWSSIFYLLRINSVATFLIFKRFS